MMDESKRMRAWCVNVYASEDGTFDANVVELDMAAADHATAFGRIGEGAGALGASAYDAAKDALASAMPEPGDWPEEA